MGLLCSLSLLLLAACHSDDNEPIPADGQSRTVTITLNLQDFQTRTISGTEDDAVTRLLMQVIDNGSKESLQRIPIESGTATTTIQLYPSHSYTFLFWADDESYTATDLTAITLGNGLSDTQAGIAYAACIAWDGTATINATLKHAVSKVTLKTTSRVWADNELTFTIPQTHSGYNVQASAPTGTAATHHRLQRRERHRAGQPLRREAHRPERQHWTYDRRNTCSSQHHSLHCRMGAGGGSCGR